MSAMIDPAPLFTPGQAWSSAPSGLPLIALLTGYRDAGATVAQTVEALLETDAGEPVAVFDHDLLLDYRARRPVIRVEGYGVAEYRRPRLDLRLLHDSIGQPFLLLSGFEPDFRWEGFTEAVLRMHAHFGVTSVTWAHAVPMPVPHTRPIRLAVTGNRDELSNQLSVWRANVEAPAHALHLLEHELTRADAPVADLVVLSPHYLSDAALPATALRLLEALGTATGLLFATEAVRERDREFRGEFDASVAEQKEVQRLIGALETQYDGFVRDTPQANPFADADGEMPSGDDIAAELARFLKSRTDEEK